jgi:hypothetical protein
MKRTIFILTMTVMGCNGSSLYDQRSGRSSPIGNGGSEGTVSVGSGGSSSNGPAPPGEGGVLSGAGTTGSATGGSAGESTVSALGGTSGGGTTNSGPATGGSVVAGSGPDSGAPGAGGTVVVGGATGRGGASGTGGATGVGAATGAGGSQGTGGTSATAPPGTGGANGAGGAPGAGGSSASCVPAASPGSKGMNTGQACVSCHGNGQSPTITLGGTVYGSATGGSGVSGATVTITESNGKKTTLVTGSSGNFYTGTAIAFPAKVEVSKCPDTATMGTTITSGDCNSCHGSSMRIHLP